jgi:hypothetical protein
VGLLVNVLERAESIDFSRRGQLTLRDTRAR